MWFIVLGVLLILMKLADVVMVGAWSWWTVLAPFGLAALWWAWADKSGYTKRKEMDKMEDRKRERREKNLVALGIDPRAYDKKKAVAFKASRAKAVAKVESQREAQRKGQRDSILNSRFDSGRVSSRLDDTTQETKRE